MSNSKKQKMSVIGIDVSKPHLDVALLNEKGELIDEQRIINGAKALKNVIARWQRDRKCTASPLVCLEATGHYGYVAISALLEMNVDTWVAHPADIQLSLGMQRGKNDKVDARRIAWYAFKHPEKARIIDVGYLKFEEFKLLLTSREFFVRSRAKCLGQLKDNVYYLPKQIAPLIKKELQRQVSSLGRSITNMELKIEAFICDDEQLRTKRDLICTVSGIGKIVANEILAVTRGFTRLTEPRKLACYAGLAPFEHSSGKSVRGRTRVSHRANKHLKSLIHLAAMAAVRKPGDISTYYQRKLAEGKKPISALNAVRNKVVHHMCAVLESGQPYKPYLQES